MKVCGSIKFHYDITRILGFGGDTLTKASTTRVRPYEAMPSGGFYNMHLYCDVLVPQVVDNIKAPLQRILSVESKPDDSYLAKRFSTIYYIPLVKLRPR